MTFTSGDKVGAAYYITSANRSDGPWTYTVEAGKSLSDAWTVSGAYDFSVFGPNGFLREFKGDRTAAAPIVEIIKSGDRGNLRVSLTNPGTTGLKVVVTDGYGAVEAKTFNLKPDQVATWHSNLRGSGYWYDVTVKSGAHVRRLAGHVETDRPSTSDPAIATV
jgi:phospholipase C